MAALPSPWWPVLVLACVTLGDALLCVRPVPFVARCLEDVRFPRRYWRWLPVVKLAAVAGLLAGLVVPWLGLVTTSCLVAYFVVAVVMHVRARDLGRTLFLNATGMLLLCLAVLVWCFLVGHPPASAAPRLG